MELISFYISEYLIYGLVFVIVIFLSLAARKFFFSHREDSWQIFLIINAASYFILFSGFVGGFIKPYLTDINSLIYKDYFNKIGTGSFVNSNIVMTNAHMVYGCGKIAARDKNHLYKAELIAYEKKGGVDIAFIRTSANKKNFAFLSNQDPKIGDIVFYPNYTSRPGIFTKSKGKVSADLGDQIIFLAPKGRQGNSGSPVFNNKGYLIGLLYGGGGILSADSAATSLKEIKNFAKKNGVQLFSIKNQKIDLSKEENFLDERVVQVLCSFRNS